MSKPITAKELAEEIVKRVGYFQLPTDDDVAFVKKEVESYSQEKHSRLLEVAERMAVNLRFFENPFELELLPNRLNEIRDTLTDYQKLKEEL